MKREYIERELKTIKDDILNKKTSLFDFEGLYSEMEMSLPHLEPEEEDQVKRQMKELKLEMDRLNKRINKLTNRVHKYDLELYNLDVQKNKEMLVYNT
jgi:chromosome segregation ATPase